MMTDPTISPIPITESSHPITVDLDVAEPGVFLRLLRQVDMQIFSGWMGYDSVLDDVPLEMAARLAWRMSRHFLGEEEKGPIILSGAGTSGRLAFFLVREFNRQLRAAHGPECFRACIAGGERALVLPVEGAEDRGSVGVEDLHRLVGDDAAHGLYIGISAGLSAPYVAAQLADVQKRPNWHAALIGFNPLELARTASGEPGYPSMADAIACWGDNPRFLPLVPVYGPEAVRGSTRMKGGTVTKLLLETVFSVALEIAGLDEGKTPLALGPDGSLLPLRARLIELILRYRAAMDAAYLNLPRLTELVRLAGATLRSQGRIYYLGRGSAGMLGMMDAAECPPTFGTDPMDVRGFVADGWTSWLGEGRDLAQMGKPFRASYQDFREVFLPEIDRADLVIAVAISGVGESTRDLLLEAAGRKARTAVLLAAAVAPKPGELPHADVLCDIEVPALGLRPGSPDEAELALKVCLNAVTTGANAMAGRIYQNVMVDLRLSNTKLYERATRSIAELTRVDLATARLALHRAICQQDTLTDEQRAMPALDAVRMAGERRGIVPLALLLAAGQMTVSEAKRALSDDPVVRRALQKALAR
jgi:N-acetylmuramic acid 6-phosphate (MurNAc-6-P) etherase